jgi:hypothetical protein
MYSHIDSSIPGKVEILLLLLRNAATVAHGNSMQNSTSRILRTDPSVVGSYTVGGVQDWDRITSIPNPLAPNSTIGLGLAVQ